MRLLIMDYYKLYVAVKVQVDKKDASCLRSLGNDLSHLRVASR